MSNDTTEKFPEAPETTPAELDEMKKLWAGGLTNADMSDVSDEQNHVKPYPGIKAFRLLEVEEGAKKSVDWPADLNSGRSKK